MWSEKQNNPALECLKSQMVINYKSIQQIVRIIGKSRSSRKKSCRTNLITLISIYQRRLVWRDTYFADGMTMCPLDKLLKRIHYKEVKMLNTVSSFKLMKIQCKYTTLYLFTTNWQGRTWKEQISKSSKNRG